MSTLSIRDIAKMAGVSVTTVSRVLNNYPDVSEGTKRRVQRVIAECDYQPNNAARNLKRTHSNAVGLLMEGSATPFITDLSDIIEAEINAHGYTLVPHRVTNGVSGVDTAVQLVMEKRLKGLIICGGYFIHSLEQLKRLPVPAVFCTTTLSGIDHSTYSSVHVDDRQAAMEAVNYLVSIGHRDIAILGGIENDSGGVSGQRLSGYYDALKQHHIPLDPTLVCYGGLFTMQRGYDATCELLSGSRQPSAVFCVADSLAVGACKAIFNAGLRVPQDISVMGFDGTDMARFYEPSICTVRQPKESIAKKTVEVLISLMEKKGPNRHIIFPTEIVTGGSCASPGNSVKSHQ
ncbi:MAG: LacI family DNA-binding transcriptional regulator [Oscillospiraceae bacterium]|nr:LacI family DNA-binding transcriptional regulator [Oscillospiraceae bacterium]